jgi:hypothetical protein
MRRAARLVQTPPDEPMAEALAEAMALTAPGTLLQHLYGAPAT